MIFVCTAGVSVWTPVYFYVDLLRMTESPLSFLVLSLLSIKGTEGLRGPPGTRVSFLCILDDIQDYPNDSVITFKNMISLSIFSGRRRRKRTTRGEGLQSISVTALHSLILAHVILSKLGKKKKIFPQISLFPLDSFCLQKIHSKMKGKGDVRRFHAKIYGHWKNIDPLKNQDSYFLRFQTFTVCLKFIFLTYYFSWLEGFNFVEVLTLLRKLDVHGCYSQTETFQKCQDVFKGSFRNPYSIIRQ